MATDFSRIRLNPLLDYAGVELKQGGVLLDADANELVDIVDRRLRALASDVLGRATVSSTTVDAFKLAVSGTSLTIGKGRLYVDGLLAENHGAVPNDPAKRLFDPLMAERQFADPIAYAAQPYLPSPPALPTAGRHLVYLDVWNREVTYVEQPNLVESAVGVDASSRIQTVWQVRALAQDAGQATCASPDGDFPGWVDTISASTGVLTTGTFQVAPVDDPCELPPTGGYRGLENQLYRVEIHDPGQPGGTATFKWSRENASVAARVERIQETVITVFDPARDPTLGFGPGQLVELTDLQRTLSGQPGVLVQLESAQGPTMSVREWPGGAPPVLGAEPVVRRWESPAALPVTSGTPTAPAWVDLEDGVQVEFIGDEFRTGDYWLIPARTLTGTVEWPQVGGERRYVCAKGPGHSGCGRMAINAEPIEAFLAEAVLTQLDAPAVAAALAAAHSADAATAAEHDALRQDREQLDELAKAYGDRLVTFPEWLAARAPIEARIDAAQRKLSRMSRSAALDPYVGKSEALRAIWQTLPKNRQRSIVAALLDRAVIRSAVPGRATFDADRIAPVWRA